MLTRGAALTALGVALALGVATLAAIRAELDGGWALRSLRGLRAEFNDRRLADSQAAVPCPPGALVLLALGQSNAANHVGTPVSHDPARPVHAFFRDRCMLAADPLPGATGTGGSLWIRLAQGLTVALGRPVIIVSAAASGSSVADWHYDHARILSRALRSVAGLRSTGLSINAVLWLQGETDTERGTTADAYVHHLEGLIARIDAEASPSGDRAHGPIWIIFQTSRCWGRASASVIDAQSAVLARLVRVHAGPATDWLGGAERSDGCHFNDVGRTRIVDELQPQLVALFGPAGEGR